MRWTGMPMAMWVVFARSFQTQLTAVLGYDPDTARKITEKAKLDGWYVEHLSFGLDVKCFFGTIAAVLKHDGVVEGGTGTLHEETGKENH